VAIAITGMAQEAVAEVCTITEIRINIGGDTAPKM